jgi:hypothetical protein
VVLRHQAPGTEIDLFFQCPIDGTATVEELNAAFAFAVLQELPHGISSPRWRFRILTPSSSFSDGVTFARDPGGRLRVSVETPLFAIFGHSERASCQPPAGGSSAGGCHLQREHRIPLDLTLLVPYDLARLH